MSVPWLYWRKTYVSGKPKYHMFRKPFDEGGILSGARQLQCSNGMIFKTDEWPFKPEETFFKELWTEGESTWLITEEKDCRYTGLRQVADSISDNALLQVLPIKNTSNWELTFRMNNVLSGDYDVCAIILPQTAINPDATALKPCKFKAAVNYVDLEGKDQVYDCENQQFTTDPERVDTVVLAESFHFPATNYRSYDILSSEPDSAVFVLHYPEWEVGTGRISLDKKVTVVGGTYFCKVEDTYTFSGLDSDSLTVAAGIFRHPGQGTIEEEISTPDRIAIWEKASDQSVEPEDGMIGVAVIVPGASYTGLSTGDDHSIAVRTIASGETFSYMFGSCWSKGSIKDADSWFELVKSTTVK
jgi:hypothetical protein